MGKPPWLQANSCRACIGTLARREQLDVEGDFSLRGLVFHFQMTCSMIGGGGRLVLKIRVSGAANVNPGHRLAYHIWYMALQQSAGGHIMAHCLDNVGSLESICLYSISMIHQANILPTLPTTQPWSRSASWIQGAVVSQVKRTCVSRCRRYLACVL